MWRTFVRPHRPSSRVPDAAWALPDEEARQARRIWRRAISPQSAYLRLVGLFQSWTPYIGARRLDDYEGFERELGRQRVEAIKEIEAEGGFDAITKTGTRSNGTRVRRHRPGERRLVARRRTSWLVGVRGPGSRRHRDVVLFGPLCARRVSISSQASSRRTTSRSISVLDSCLSARDDLPEAWALAAADPELETRYWTAFQPLGLGQDFDKVDEVADRLIQAGAPRRRLALHEHVLPHREGRASPRGSEAHRASTRRTPGRSDSVSRCSRPADAMTSSDCSPTSKPCASTLSPATCPAPVGVPSCARL